MGYNLPNNRNTRYPQSLDTTVSRRQADAGAWGLGLLTLGLPIALLMPGLGLALAGTGAVLLAMDRWVLA